jgi:nitrate/nitrite-specific signal transduction histidine kinase
MIDKAAKIKKIKTVRLKIAVTFLCVFILSTAFMIYFQNLKGIEKLKELIASGKELDHNQLKKVERETELLKELESLQL